MKKITLYAIALTLVGNATYGLTLGPSLVNASLNDTAYQKEVECLAKNIYFESANQPYAGRVAVALVTLNRVDSPKFPNTVCDVVYQARTKPSWKTGEPVPIRNQCQFSWYCDGKPDIPYDTTVWEQSMYMANNIYSAYVDTTSLIDDITEGATFYHATYVNPHWVSSVTRTIRIEDHIFYRD